MSAVALADQLEALMLKHKDAVEDVLRHSKSSIGVQRAAYYDMTGIEAHIKRLVFGNHELIVQALRGCVVETAS